MACACDVKLARVPLPARGHAPLDATINLGTFVQATKSASELVTYVVFAVGHGDVGAIDGETILIIFIFAKRIPPAWKKKR